MNIMIFPSNVIGKSSTGAKLRISNVNNSYKQLFVCGLAQCKLSFISKTIVFSWNIMPQHSWNINEESLRSKSYPTYLALFLSTNFLGVHTHCIFLNSRSSFDLYHSELSMSLDMTASICSFLCLFLSPENINIINISKFLRKLN